MLAKLLFAIAGVTVIGASLLSMQQQRLLAAHAMSDLHVQMDRDRKATWDAQARIAEGSHPAALREAVSRVGIELEPMPSPPLTRSPSVAWPDPTHFSHAPAPGQIPTATQGVSTTTNQPLSERRP